MGLAPSLFQGPPQGRAGLPGPFGRSAPTVVLGDLEFTPSGCKYLGPGAPCFVTQGRCPQDLEGAKGRVM